MTESLTRQERRAVLLDSPAFEKFRTVRWRRILCAVLIGVFVAEVALIVGVTVLQLPLLVFLVGMLVLIVAMVFSLGALKASTRGVEELSPAVLDERQAQIRGLVYSTSYTVLSVFFILAVLVLWLAQSSWWSAPFESLLIVPMLAIQLIVTIPTFVTALRTDV
jgi:hypothetical protein